MEKIGPVPQTDLEEASAVAVTGGRNVRDKHNGLQCQIGGEQFVGRNLLFKHLEESCLSGQLARSETNDKAHHRRWRARQRNRRGNASRGGLSETNAAHKERLAAEAEATRKAEKETKERLAAERIGKFARRTWKDFPSPSQVRALRRITYPFSRLCVFEGDLGTVLSPSRKSKEEGKLNVEWHVKRGGT